jgi:7-keto-8-aminopelargonate synthetase-like enzyme
MDLIASIDRKLAALDEQNLTRRLRVAETRCAPLQVVDGRPMLAFCSNDYLGLAAHPRVVEALREGAQLYGAGSGASHLVSGHSRAHAALEERLAQCVAPYLESARALEHFDLRSPNLVYVGTLGKAAGVSGAFVAAHASVIELMIQRARPYIYTTAAPPALAHALLASLDIIAGDEGKGLRAHLQSLLAQLDADLRLTRWQRLASSTPIQPIVIGSNDEALRVAAGLHERGLWVPAIRPPTVAPGTARLRVTLSAAHTHEEVAQLAAALIELERT